MIIKKMLTGALGFMSMAVVIVPIEACGGERTAEQANEPQSANTSTTTSRAAASARSAQRRTQASSPLANREVDQAGKSSLAELRHFAAYARYRALASTSGDGGPDDAGADFFEGPDLRIDNAAQAGTFACPDPGRGD